MIDGVKKWGWVGATSAYGHNFLRLLATSEGDAQRGDVEMLGRGGLFAEMQASHGSRRGLHKSAV